MKADDGLPVQIPRTFAPLSGTSANLTVSGTTQTVTLTQVIPQGGCNVRIVTSGGNVRVRFDGAAATTNDVLLLAGTVEVFTLSSGAAITAIFDTGVAAATLNVTLGMGA